jgi:hypothetical protein
MRHEWRFEIEGDDLQRDIHARVRRAVERTERHIERQLKPRLAHVEQRLRQTLGEAHRHTEWAGATPPAVDTGQRDEERLTILRMLEAGKITAEDAIRLLNAL